MTTEQSTSVTRSIVIDAPVEHTFAVFTEDMASWWPPEHHILEAEVAGIDVERRPGGHITSRGVDGSECRWARVLTFEPPSLLVFSWDISLQWQLEADPARTSEVAVRFEEAGPGSTLVTLEHRHLDRHGDGWSQMRDAVADEDGWERGLRALAGRATTTHAERSR